MRPTRDRFRRRIARLACLLAFAWLAANGVVGTAWADGAAPHIFERSAVVQVHADGSADVTETTVIVDGAGVPFERVVTLRGHGVTLAGVTVTAASVNGTPVTWQANASADELAISIEAAPAARNSYVLSFHVATAVNLYDHQARVAWPIADPVNQLPIDDAAVQVQLPDGVPSQRIRPLLDRDGGVIRYNPYNQDEMHYDGSEVSFHWSAGIAPHESMAAVVEYPPDAASAAAIDAARTAAQNAPSAALSPTVFDGRYWLLLLAFYYAVVKIFLTLTASKKPLVAEYEPPAGFSAGAVRLLWHGVWDRKCFSAGILGLAAKGALAISKRADGTFVATRAGADDLPALTGDERRLRDALFALDHSIAFNASDAERVDIAETGYRRAVEQRCASQRPTDLAVLLIPGWLICLPAVLLQLVGYGEGGVIAAKLVAAAAITVIAALILHMFVAGGILRAIRVQAMVAAGIVVIALLARVGLANGLCIAALLGGQILGGAWLLRQPGNESPLMGKLRGFRWYLGTAEQQDMNARYKPSLHPELQASLLPFAMALDVEVAWNAHFAHTVRAAEQQGFIANVNSGSFEHAIAAQDLLNFAQAMSQRAQAGSAAAATDTPGG